ncbi:hypothetical protein RB595_007541 [Gaeumannomyces hyphopodioides]
MAIRLINTETLRMKTFVGGSVPRYAILSHTWVDGEEVSFEEMTRFGAVPPDAILQNFVEDSGGSHGEAPGNKAGVWKQLHAMYKEGEDAQELDSYADSEGEDINFEALALAVEGPKTDGSVATKRICRCSCHCDCCAAVVDPAAVEVRRKPGYQKIAQTCRIAKKHGLDWAWVDTCCIDKSSSAELSEAINSMFKWYRNSAVCYAFLSDLDPDAKRDIEGALRKCRWFTRGWTLQELLAPGRVFFFNPAWRVIGSKRTLQLILDRITGIEKQALAGGNGARLGDYSVATKMTWASKRQTTRVEDVAYCLLGIFNVNMPLLYGEGEKAFRRLQEEILRCIDDPSIFYSFAHGGDADEPFRDVFAATPAQFCSKCSKGESIYNIYQCESARTSFTMTSKGLLVQNPVLLPCNPPGVRSHFYLLFLNVSRYYQSGERGQGTMSLSWSAPGHYVRLRAEVAQTDLRHFKSWRNHCRGRRF